MSPLSIQQVESYNANGFLSGLPVLSPPEAQCIRQHFSELERREGPDKCQRGLYDPHFTEQFVWNLATDQRVLDYVKLFIGTNILLMATHFFCKYGPSDAFVAWHQDLTYWGLMPEVSISAWYSVDDSDAENGCVQVIPGTHTSGIRQHGKADVAGNLLSINQEVILPPGQEKRAVNLELRTGEMSLHHGLTIHGSRPNRSARRRCGLSMIYVPTHVKQVAKNSLGEMWKAFLVHGENREGFFENSRNPFPSKPA